MYSSFNRVRCACMHASVTPSISQVLLLLFHRKTSRRGVYLYHKMTPSPNFGRCWVVFGLFLRGGPKFGLEQRCSTMDLEKAVPPWRRKSWRKMYSNTMMMQNQAKLAAEGTNLENTPPLMACVADRGVDSLCISG